MFFYFILFTGFVLFLLNFRNWYHLNRQILKDSQQGFRFVNYIKNYKPSIIQEWSGYVFSERSLKKNKMLWISIIGVIGAFIVNNLYLKLPLMLCAVGTLALLMIVQTKVGRFFRKRAFEVSFPEVLGVLSASVSAGNSINQALKRCGERVKGELGESISIVERRLNLGEDPEIVFFDLWKKYPYKELYFFNVVMLISMSHGGQLKLLISRLSRILANSKKIEKRTMAMTSEARMSAKIVASLPVLFFFILKLTSPENFDFVLYDPKGRIIFYYVLVSEILGLWSIRWLLKRAT